MEKVSIIVPIFNGEKYIDKCLKSLINQTYTNLEIIFINTGSTDNSLNLLKNYQKLDKRIIIIDKKENEGVSVARNLGLKKSTGDFITFADVDDWLELDAIYNMVSLIKKYDVDIVRTNYKRVEPNITFIAKTYKNNELLVLNKENKDQLLKDALKQNYGCYLWLLLIKSKIIKENNINFDDNIYVYQDLAFYTNIFRYCNSIYFSNIITYNYLNNSNGSKNNKYFDRNLNSTLDLQSVLKKRLGKHYENYINNLCVSLIIPSYYYLYKENDKLCQEKYNDLLNDKRFYNIISTIKIKDIDKKMISKYLGILCIKKHYSYKTFKLIYFTSYKIYLFLRNLKNQNKRVN